VCLPPARHTALAIDFQRLAKLFFCTASKYMAVINQALPNPTIDAAPTTEEQYIGTQ
jgi:hypothetical protein